MKRDSPRPRRLLWVCDPARRSGRGATFAPKSRIGDVWSATLPQSDKGRVARHLPAMSGRHDLPTSPKGTSFLRGVRAALATRGFNAPGQYVGRGGRGAGEDRGLLNAPPSARIPHQLGPPCAFQLRGDMKARATVLTLAL